MSGGGLWRRRRPDMACKTTRAVEVVALRDSGIHGRRAACALSLVGRGWALWANSTMSRITIGL
jgi:hypothetical protein